MLRWISACFLIFDLKVMCFPHSKQEYPPTPSFRTMASSAAFRSRRGSILTYDDNCQRYWLLILSSYPFLIVGRFEVPCPLMSTFISPIQIKKIQECDKFFEFSSFYSQAKNGQLVNLVTLSKVSWLRLGVPWYNEWLVHSESWTLSDKRYKGGPRSGEFRRVF